MRHQSRELFRHQFDRRVQKEVGVEFSVRIKGHVRGKAKIRKTFLIMGLMLLIIGIVLAVFSIQESHAEENAVGRWDNIWPYALKPQSEPGPIWAIEMPEGGGFFELNVSATDTVRVRIGSPGYDNVTEKDVLLGIVFDQVGTRFTQKVAVGGSGYYEVEIKNEGTASVGIWGDVVAKKAEVTHQTVYPYSSLGTLVMLGGLTSLIYGVLTKPKKRHGSPRNVGTHESARLSLRQWFCPP